MNALQPEGARLVANLERVILGKPAELQQLVVAVLAAGHVLMEDVPGVGKTTLARALARSTSLDFRRVQFTPDLMPSDILGAAVLRPSEGALEFQPGPVFTNVLLADEVNRASPRTQSALLEAMSERQVTTDGLTRALPVPFLVLATQNPVEYQGTYPLPEAQLDRFLMRVRLGYPSAEEELNILYQQQQTHPLETLQPVLDAATLSDLQRRVRAIRVERSVGAYLLALCRRTRAHPELALGASPRGALALFRAAQGRAFLLDRDFVTPDDVQALAVPVLAHRLALHPQARYQGRGADRIVLDILSDVPVPAS